MKVTYIEDGPLHGCSGTVKAKSERLWCVVLDNGVIVYAPPERWGVAK